MSARTKPPSGVAGGVDPAVSDRLHNAQDDLCRQVYEIESLLACVRARLESAMESSQEPALLPIDVVLRVAGDHVAELGESIQEVLATIQRLAPTPAPAPEAAEA